MKNVIIVYVFILINEKNVFFNCDSVVKLWCVIYYYSCFFMEIFNRDYFVCEVWVFLCLVRVEIFFVFFDEYVWIEWM